MCGVRHGLSSHQFHISSLNASRPVMTRRMGAGRRVEFPLFAPDAGGSVTMMGSWAVSPDAVKLALSSNE